MHFFFLRRIACTPTLFYFSFCSYFLALVINKSPAVYIFYYIFALVFRLLVFGIYILVVFGLSTFNSNRTNHKLCRKLANEKHQHRYNPFRRSLPAVGQYRKTPGSVFFKRYYSQTFPLFPARRRKILAFSPEHIEWCYKQQVYSATRRCPSSPLSYFESFSLCL